VLADCANCAFLSGFGGAESFTGKVGLLTSGGFSDLKEVIL